MKLTYGKSKGYKYHVKIRPFIYELPYPFNGQMANLEYIILVNNKLFIKIGYHWDGASGWFDTQAIMRGALVHDALYQLMRQGEMTRTLRIEADRLLRDICIMDGMSRFMANRVYNAVRLFGGRRSRNGVENYDKIYETKGE